MQHDHRVQVAVTVTVPGTGNSLTSTDKPTAYASDDAKEHMCTRSVSMSEVYGGKVLGQLS